MGEHKDLPSGKAYGATLLAPEDAWIAHLDHEKFREDVHAMGKTLSNNQGKEDLRHLSKIVWMSRLCQWIGFATMWYCVNPISIFFLSMGTLSRWTIIGHHVCHGGFDNVTSPSATTASRSASEAYSDAAATGSTG